jgi:DNA-binding response OmpR family regulator
MGVGRRAGEKLRRMTTMPKRPQILLADDNDTNLDFLKRSLAAIDCEIKMATDGVTALQQIQRSRPDVVVLSPRLPKVSGLEICRQIKSDASTTSSIRVLMVTPLNDLSDIERAVEAGADDFLSRPINASELVKRVTNMLRSCS